MHPEAYEFVRRTLEGHHLDGASVVEVGSYDVNGGVRPLFAAAADYVGIDTRRGPGVDVVADGAAWDGAGQRFDYAVSTEALEHSPSPAAVLANLRRLLKPGGWLILTMASETRAPHGSDGHPLRDGETYTRITKADLAGWLGEWDQVEIHNHPSRGDLYATARRPAGRAPVISKTLDADPGGLDKALSAAQERARKAARRVQEAAAEAQSAQDRAAAAAERSAEAEKRHREAQP